MDKPDTRRNRLELFKGSLEIGMEADEVLKLAKKYRIKFTSRPETISRVGDNYVVRWHYPGIRLVMRRIENPGPYKIGEMEVGELVQS